ncbi:hypothetical protein A678_03286 [Salmonella enterica subsp. enterica serovar Enteritidis str. 2010K-0271]|uniref:Uncharacterized protein n=1 Tax=Salmonella enteritidis (strain 2009K0958) TaxID=1192586 RepID=A0A656IIN6_SALE2|nr:hypothetical protein A673_01996 [Salmonella enterica subsp. enterica serovar Enteritidis str. 2009K0958]EPI99508.1 hypothetical protein A678_03286 [Salmonella enterica subsp. enterica serovar Enteritidis str. 2010K-0271]
MALYGISASVFRENIKCGKQCVITPVEEDFCFLRKLTFCYLNTVKTRSLFY